MSSTVRPLAAFLAAALFVCTATAAEPTPEKRAELIPFGSVAPEVAGIILHGATGTKLSQYRGRVVAVDFWATWCTPCLQSMPELNRVRNELVQQGYGDKFEILGVNVDNDVSLARRFLEVHPVDYPIIGDPVGIAMKRYGPWKLPATFLLTPEGKVHMIWLGYADYFGDDIKKVALELLKQQDAAAQPTP
jgi:thiol-disulfide isomerase/thioredoxin